MWFAGFDPQIRIKMKNLKFFVLSIAALSLLFTGCSKEQEQTPTGSAKVSVHVSDFTISMSEIQTKDGTNPASYDGVGALTLAFYDANGNEAVKTTQIKNDNTTYTVFGDFECDLPVGNYTMVALGYYYYDGDVFVLTSPTEAAFTSERPRETFCKVQSVTVTGTDALDLSVMLNRINAKLEIISTDNRPAGIARIRTTFAKGGKAFNPTTGLATSDAGFWQTNSPSAAVGTPIDIGSMPFLFTDEETMNITIEVLDAGDNVLTTKVVNNVPFKRNRLTTLTGAVFTADPSGVGFQLNTAWDENGDNVNF